MSYVLKTNTANRSNYGSARNTSLIKYLVIHFTANDGDTDEGNGNYFKNNVVKASAHYFVDSDSVTQSVPDNYVAWSVGGKKYSDCASTGGGKFYGVVTNTNSISIEICDDRKNGEIHPSAATIENAIAFSKTIMAKYNIPIERVVRHFDVTGKRCPDYWCGTAEKNAAWLSEFHNKLAGDTAEAPTPVLNQGAKGDAVKRLQERLNAWGFDLDVDGSFGSATLAAVKEFQSRSGLEVDGSVGPLTWAALEEVKSLAKFPDIDGHWAEKDIDKLVEMGIVHGDSDGHFRPDDAITRAEAATLIRNTVLYITGK